MTELEILRGIAILYALCRYIVIALMVYAIWKVFKTTYNWWNKYSFNKTQKEIEARRTKFNQDCERVGKRMHNIDEIHRTVHNFNKHQRITCKGYFTGSDIEAYIAKV